MARYIGGGVRGIMPLEKRFQIMVERSENTDSCWRWKGKKRLSRYYPAFKIAGKQIQVHRWAYEFFVGPISPGLVVDHLCNNKNCSNPWHLEPKTRRENTLRGDTPARRNAEKKWCSRGHVFDDKNTGWAKAQTNDRMYRFCKECSRIVHLDICRRYRERKRNRQQHS